MNQSNEYEGANAPGDEGGAGPRETAFAAASDPLAWLDAHAQARLVADGEVSARELVAAAIERITELQPRINALIHERFARALDAADDAAARGPFGGVPILLKDLGSASAGDPFHMGNQALADAGIVADHDARFVSRLRAAGFVPLGRTNVPEFGLSTDCRSLPYGDTRNPWALDRTSGGSSGGSAAAVASGMVAVATGGDALGSLRVPAAHCGLVSLKVSRGRISAAPDTADPLLGFAVPGVLARSVRDVAAFTDLVSGYEPGDPIVAPPLARPLAQEVERDPRPLRIGFVDRALRRDLVLDERCAAAVRAAAVLLEELGHEIEEAHPRALAEEDHERLYRNALAPDAVNRVRLVERLAGRRVSDAQLSPLTADWVAHGRAMTAADLDATILALHDHRRRMAAWWAEGFDLLLSPVNLTPAAELDAFWTEGGLQRFFDAIQFTPQFNSTGQPAIAVPMGAPGGLPVGVQLVAALGREDLLIAVAAQMERARS